LQQAAFDELVYEVDVMRNVATRRTQAEKEEAEHKKERDRRLSLPVGYNAACSSFNCCVYLCFVVNVVASKNSGIEII
jgi:hypothetical protein